MIQNLIKLQFISRSVSSLSSLVSRNMSSIIEGSKFETFALSSPKPFVVHVELNRPSKLNAMNNVMWEEFGKVFNLLNNDPDCRVIVLSGSGKVFCAGIDLTHMMHFGQEISQHEDVARKGQVIVQKIKLYQDSISSMENCVKPVINAIHSACIGAGVDIASTADIRYCTKDAYFQLKEVDIGMAADVGSLQRFPKAIGNQSLVRELCLTGRKFDSDEALRIGFVNRIFDNKELLLKSAIEIAEEIAKKSPVAVQATKQSLVYSQNRTNQDGLDHIRTMNTYLLQSEDLVNATMAQAASKGKDQPAFAKL